jgi:hypothetical protein
MKTLYYTVEKELQQVDNFEETTGFKTVTVYKIEDNKPTKFFTLEIHNDEKTKGAINDYLSDNGYEDEFFELIQL